MRNKRIEDEMKNMKWYLFGVITGFLFVLLIVFSTQYMNNVSCTTVILPTLIH
jgi:hypothetical protein